MGVEVVVNTDVLVRNKGELLVSTELAGPFTKALSVAQKLLGRLGKQPSKSALADSGIEGGDLTERRGSLMLCVLGPERGVNFHSVCVKNEMMCFIIKVVQLLQTGTRGLWGDGNVLKVNLVTVAQL